jgi:hypothetical protein
MIRQLRRSPSLVVGVVAAIAAYLPFLDAGKCSDREVRKWHP